MIDLQIYVTGLLVAAAVGMAYIIKVMARQIALFRITESKEIQIFRRKLFAISVVIVVSALVPIFINAYTLIGDTGRPPMVPVVSVIYSSSVHLQLILLSYLLWSIYRRSDNEKK